MFNIVMLIISSILYLTAIILLCKPVKKHKTTTFKVKKYSEEDLRHFEIFKNQLENNGEIDINDNKCINMGNGYFMCNGTFYEIDLDNFIEMWKK